MTERANTAAAEFEAVALFEAEQEDFRAKRPRPPTPDDDHANEVWAWRWYGWMIARGRDIGFISKQLEWLGVDINTQAGERIFHYP